MAKTLTLVDGTAIEFTDASTISKLVGVYSTFAEIDTILASFTTDNLNGADFDGSEVTDVVALGVSVPVVASGENVTAYFTTRAKTDVELLQESQDEQNAIIDALLMGE